MTINADVLPYARPGRLARFEACAGDEFEDMDDLFASLPDELLR